MSNSTFSNQRDAVNSFVGSAIESNLLDTVKALISTFPNDVDFKSHEITLSFYNVYRGENAEMMSFLFEKGAELEQHQLPQVVEQSPIDTFKVIFKHYQQWFEQRRKKGYSVQVTALFKDRLELIPFLSEQGFGLDRNSLPLKELLESWGFHDSHIYAYAFSAVPYTMADFSNLDDEEQQSFLLRLSKSSEQEVAAITNSELGGVLDIPELQDHTLKNNNAALLSAILARGNNIKSDVSCDASDFLNDPKSFSVAIQRDPMAKLDIEEGKNSFYVDRLIGQAFTTSCVDVMKLAIKHIYRLSQLKKGNVVDASVRPIIEKALINIEDPAVLDVFFDILPERLFADNDMVEFAIGSAMPLNNVTPFLLRAESKGLTLDATFFDNCLEPLSRSRFTYKAEPERFKNIKHFLCFARERLGERAYMLLLDKTDYHGKSEKQILSGFRKAYYSNNISEKSTTIMMLLVLASDEKRLSYLEAMSKVDDLREDIAFTEIMKAWRYDPITLLSLPVSDNLKSSMISALSD